MTNTAERDVARLVGLFDAVRREHMIDVVGLGLMACTCGERLRVIHDEEGQPLYNPAIRHHHEQYAVAIVRNRVLPPANGEGGDR